jgi:phage-related protein
MQSIAGMSWGEIAKGLVGIAGALVVLSFGLAGMAGAIPGAIAIAIVALVLGKLADGLKKFAALKWSELLKGLVGLAAIFAVLAVAALLMEPVIPAMLALGAALILIGAGIALFGLGANLLASAFAIIATAGTQGVKTLSEALQVLIDALPSFIGAFADGMLMLAAKILEALPAIITGLDGALKALIQLLIDNIPGLVAAGVELIKALIGAITDLIPDIVQLGFDLLMGLLRGIRDNIKEIVTVVVEIITQFIDGLTANIELIVASGLALLVAFLKGISDNLTELVKAVGGIITKFVEEIGNQAQSIIDAGKDFILKVIEGFGKAVKEIGDAIVQMAADFSAQCVVWADKLLQAGKDFILGILAAASKATIEIADGMFTLITNFLNGLADVINKRAPELREAGLNIVKAIINGITGFDASGLLGKAAETLAGMVTKPFKAILGIFSPSRVFLGYAGEIIAGLALGLQKTDPATSAAEDMAVSVIDAFQTALGQIPVALDGMSDFQPTITPVLDLTNVQKGASQIGGLLGQPAIPATNSLQQATLLSLQQRPTDEEDATAPAQPKEVTYIQNNYSPEALSTADIYRATRSQIAMAKEELAVA